MSATIFTRKTVPLPMKNFHKSFEIYSQYRDFNIDTSKNTIDSKFTKTDDEQYSEASNFPNFPLN